jgi:hypothetical protein
LNTWLSCRELESLAKLFGSTGIDFLCEAILNNGVVENGRKWLNLAKKLKPAAKASKAPDDEPVDVQQIGLDILNACIRCSRKEIE